MNQKYVIISGTNRLNSNTIKVARLYQEIVKARGVEVDFFSLEGWQWLEKNPIFDAFQAEILMPAQKFIWLIPEYNGSIPGILKLMIDISNHKQTWQRKKSLLTGVSTGRAGNLRGLEHMTGILHYLQMVVHPNKLPISQVDRLLDASGNISDAGTLQAINHQIEEFIQF